MVWCGSTEHDRDEDMPQMRSAAIVLGAILAVPVVGLAAPRAIPAADKTAKSTSTKTHSVRGVVKSVDPTTLVIERGSGKNKKDMTFAMDGATHRNGEINVGSTVAVRYKTEASKVMALSVQPVTHQPAAHKAAAASH
jgi:hypothetical protein